MRLLHLSRALGRPTATASIIVMSAFAAAGARTLAAQSDAAGASRTVAASPASVVGVVAPSAVATVTTNDKVVSGSFGNIIGLRGQKELNLFVKGSGPLDEGDAKAPVVLADLSGLRSTTKVGLGATLVHFPWSSDVEGQREVCRRAFLDPSAAPDTVGKLVTVGLSTFPEAQRPAKRDSVLQAVVERLVRTFCHHDKVRGDYQRQFDDAGHLGLVWLASLGGEYGRTTYRYADTLGVAFRKQPTESYAANIGVGLYFPTPRLLLATGLRWEQSWDPGTSRQYCIPVGASSALQCRTVPLGAPSRSEPLLAHLEARWFINSSVGLSPHVTVDLRGDRGWGLELPVLLRQPKDAGFTSAVAVGWRSKPSSNETNDQLYLSLTVGLTFGVGLN